MEFSCDKGWVTPEMLEAGKGAVRRLGLSTGDTQLTTVYVAMTEHDPELAAMRAVVDAAVAWIGIQHEDCHRGDDDWVERNMIAYKSLDEAVRAYRAREV